MSARSRTRGQYGSEVLAMRRAYNPNSSSYIGNPGNGEVEVMTDFVQPNWRQLKRSGAVSFNSMVKEKHSYLQSGSGYRFHHSSNPANYEEYDGSLSLTLTGLRPWSNPDRLLHSSSEIRSLAVEVSTAVRSNRNRADANLSETLAESGKTADMVRNPIQAWVAKPRGRVTKTSLTNAAAQSAANFYLMMRYGVMPLIKDISTVLVNVKAIPPLRRTTRSKQASSRTELISRDMIVANWVYGATISTTVDERVSVRGMSLDEDVTESLDRLKQLGFSGKDLVTLPWELVRMSFVVDWFVNVGDVFGALADNLFASNNLGSCLTYEIEHTESTFYQGVANPNFTTYTIDKYPQGAVSRTYSKKERALGLLSPGLVVKNDFGFSKLTRNLDAFALTAQSLKGVASKIVSAHRARHIQNH